MTFNFGLDFFDSSLTKKQKIMENARVAQPSISATKVTFWFLVVNIPLFAITYYIHHLLNLFEYTHGNNIMENMGLWLLVAFKIIGANMILTQIFSDFKIK